MSLFAAYLFKSVLSTGLLTGYYWIFLRNRSLNQYNRFYLLTAMVLGLLIPLFNFKWFTIDEPASEKTEKFMMIMFSGGHTHIHGVHAWESLLTLSLATVSLGLLLLFVYRIARVWRMKKSSPNTRIMNCWLIETQSKEAPFSFFNNIFWKKNIPLDTEEGQLILEHELVHIRERHSYDKIFSQLVSCIFWMNPFNWLIQKELALVHEFIADSKSVGIGNTLQFARMLLQSHDEGRYLQPGHSFYQSPIKRRLMMIAHSIPPVNSSWRKLLPIPITLILLSLFSFGFSQASRDSARREDSLKQRKMEQERIAQAFERYHTQGEIAVNDEMARKIVMGILDNPPADRIYFINEKQATPEKVHQLKYSGISAVNMLPPEDAMKKYGVSGLKGIVAFTLK